MVVWLTGKSGVGKSTLGRALVHEFEQHGLRVILLDADSCLTRSKVPAGNSKCASATVAVRLAALALQSLQEYDMVVCASCNAYAQHRATVRDALTYPKFVEVHVDCDDAVLKRRDTHGHYTHKMSEGRRRELVFYEESGPVGLCVDTTNEDVSRTVTQIAQYVWKVLSSSVLSR